MAYFFSPYSHSVKTCIAYWKRPLYGMELVNMFNLLDGHAFVCCRVFLNTL